MFPCLLPLRVTPWNCPATSRLPFSPIVFALSSIFVTILLSPFTREYQIKQNKHSKKKMQCRITKYIFSYDTRGQSHAEARHWSEEKILGGRAFFRGDLKPARLVIDNVKGTDAGDYRCRADFYRAPTTIGHMRLDVIGMFPYSFGIYILSQQV